MIDCPKRLAPVVTIWGNGYGRLWRKSKFSFHHVPYVFNWREIWDSCWQRQLLYTTKTTLHCSSHMWMCVVLKKHITFLLMTWHNTGLTTSMQCSRHCLLYPAETPYVIASCNWRLPKPWSLRWGLYVMGKCTLKWPSPSVCHTCVCLWLTYRQNLLSDNRVSFHSSVGSFMTPEELCLVVSWCKW